MKKHILLFLLWLLAIESLDAQTNTATGVQVTPGVNAPTTVAARFASDFPNVTPDWTVEGDFYHATFRGHVDNLGRRIVYDRYANVLRTDTELDPKAYPKTIARHRAINFANEGYSLWLSYDAEGHRSYYVSTRNGVANWYDKKGRPLAVKAQ